MKHDTNSMQLFAKAAACHADERHGIRLEGHHVDFVDRILDSERDMGDVEQREAIKLCYGAWLGEWSVTYAHGKWVGLSEPTPPRIVVNGVVCSPLEAVERRLANCLAPTIRALTGQLIEWSKKSDQDLHEKSSNQIAWDARNRDTRFVNLDGLPTNLTEVLASIDPWLLNEGKLEGRSILCLAAGGGMHGPVLALAGANVTVVDFSNLQLDIDRRIAKENSLSIQTVQASIDDLSPLDNGSFDAIVQPVSSCYIRDIVRCYSEIARVLKPNGLYIAQHKQPTSLQTDSGWSETGYLIQHVAEEGHIVPPANVSIPYREKEMTEFVHTWDSLVGGLCRCGFVIEDFQEPPRGDAWAPLGSAEHRSRYIPPYVKIKARRRTR